MAIFGIGYNAAIHGARKLFNFGHHPIINPNTAPKNEPHITPVKNRSIVATKAVSNCPF